MTPDQQSDILEKIAADLMEHFDSVEIICTVYDSEHGRSAVINRGSGNYFARLGSIQYISDKNIATTTDAAYNPDDEQDTYE